MMGRLITALGLLAMLWLAGLIWFAQDTATMPQDMPPLATAPTDAAVALTGGSERIGAGIALLQAGVVKKLFISGVHQDTGAADILNGMNVSTDLLVCCINLGKTAIDTVGNAAETATWMERENFNSLRLVTAHYHLRRSLLLFHAAMPDVTIFPYAVAPDNVPLDHWWRRRGTANLLVTEYNKLLVAWFQDLARRAAL
jgi:uncharacterized SAM-binding protein YcdF (DUF218 family)